MPNIDPRHIRPLIFLPSSFQSLCHAAVLRRGVVSCVGAALLLGCNGQRALRSDQVEACTDPASAVCAAARDSFQLVRYPTFDAAHLVAVSNRALGDLDFETRRDDAQRKVAGDYIASAPVHSKQLDDQFRRTLKRYGQAAISAVVEVTPLAGRETGADVRLRIYAAVPGAEAPQPIDSVAPYQLFFSQLGFELGAPIR